MNGRTTMMILMNSFMLSQWHLGGESGGEPVSGGAGHQAQHLTLVSCSQPPRSRAGRLILLHYQNFNNQPSMSNPKAKVICWKKNNLKFEKTCKLDALQPLSPCCPGPSRGCQWGGEEPGGVWQGQTGTILSSPQSLQHRAHPGGLWKSRFFKHGCFFEHWGRPWWFERSEKWACFEYLGAAPVAELRAHCRNSQFFRWPHSWKQT